MSNPLEFIMKLKDMVSAPLAVMNSNGVQAYKRLENAAGAYQRKNDTIPQSIQQIKNKLNELQNTREISVSRRQIVQADREIDQLQRKLNLLDRNRGGASTGMGIGGMLRGGLAMAGIGGAMALGGAIANFGMQAEQQQTSFKVMLGSAEKAKTMLGEIRDMGAATPFNSNDLIQSTQTLLQYNVNAEKTLPIMRMLGDVSGGNAERMKSLTLAFGQVSSAGKLQGQDLAQMVQVGFNPLSIMAEKIKGQFGGDLNKAYASLREKMEQGGISAKLVEMAFQSATSKGGIYFNSMNEQSQTTGGRLSTLVENVQKVGLSIYNSVRPAINTFMDLTNYLLENKDVVVTLSGAIIAYSVYSNAANIATKIWAAGQWLLNAAMSANPIALVIGGIVLLAGAFYHAYNKVDWFRGGVLGVWEVIKGFGRFLSTAGVGMGKIIAGIFVTPSLDLIKSGVADIKTAWKDLDVTGDYNKGNKLGIAQVAAAKLKDTKKQTGATDAAPTSGDWKAAMDAAAGDKKQKKKSTGLSDSVDGVTGNAGRNVIINLGKFFDNIVINAQTIQGGIDNVESIVEECMMRIVNSTNAQG